MAARTADPGCVAPVFLPALVMLLASCAAAPEAVTSGTAPAPAKAPPAATASPITLTPAPTLSPSAPSAPLPPSNGAAEPAAPPSLGFFSKIRVPNGHDLVLQLRGQGAQIFRCDPRSDGSMAWVFRQPDAELRDARGQVVGRHGVNFSFELTDGSRLVGDVAGWDAPQRAGAVPWLLIATKSYGEGQLKGVDYVQRVDTTGGMPPAHCEAAQGGQILRVEFSAEFAFYRPH